MKLSFFCVSLALSASLLSSPGVFAQEASLKEVVQSNQHTASLQNEVFPAGSWAQKIQRTLFNEDMEPGVRAIDLLALISGQPFLSIENVGARIQLDNSKDPTHDDLDLVLIAAREIIHASGGHFHVDDFVNNIKSPDNAFRLANNEQFYAHLQALYLILSYFSHLSEVGDHSVAVLSEKILHVDENKPQQFSIVSDIVSDKDFVEKARKAIEVIDARAKNLGIQNLTSRSEKHVGLVKIGREGDILQPDSALKALFEQKVIHFHPNLYSVFFSAQNGPFELESIARDANKDTAFTFAPLHTGQEEITRGVAFQEGNRQFFDAKVTQLIEKYGASGTNEITHYFFLTDEKEHPHLMGYVETPVSDKVDRFNFGDDLTSQHILPLTFGKIDDVVKEKARSLAWFLSQSKGVIYPIQYLRQGDHDVLYKEFMQRLNQSEGFFGAPLFKVSDYPTQGFSDINRLQKRGAIALDGSLPHGITDTQAKSIESAFNRDQDATETSNRFIKNVIQRLKGNAALPETLCRIKVTPVMFEMGDGRTKADRLNLNAEEWRTIQYFMNANQLGEFLRSKFNKEPLQFYAVKNNMDEVEKNINRKLLFDEQERAKRHNVPFQDEQRTRDSIKQNVLAHYGEFYSPETIIQLKKPIKQGGPWIMKRATAGLMSPEMDTYVNLLRSKIAVDRGMILERTLDRYPERLDNHIVFEKVNDVE